MFCMQYAFPTKCVLYAICFPELHYIIFFYLGICRTSSSMAHVGILSRNDAMLKRLQLWVANMITAWAHHLPNDFFFGLRNSTYSPEHEFWISSCTLKLQHISGNAYFIYQLEMPTGSLTILYWRCLGWDCCYPLLIQEFGMWCYVLWKCETLICNPGLFWQKQMINVWNIGMLLAFFQLAIVLLCHKQFPMTLHDSSVHTNYMHLCCCKNKIACLLRYILILSYGWQTAYNSKEQLAWPWMVEMY